MKTFPQGRTKLWLTCGKEAFRSAIATRGGTTILGAMVPTESWKCTSSSSLALASRKAIVFTSPSGRPSRGKGHCYWSEEAGICSKAVPCPGHDKIAVGSTCLCGEEEAKEGQFCYEDSTVADSAKPEKSFSYSVPISWTVFLVTPLALWIG